VDTAPACTLSEEASAASVGHGRGRISARLRFLTRGIGAQPRRPFPEPTVIDSCAGSFLQVANALT